MTDADVGPSRFHYSTDRGHTWKGPFRLALVGHPEIDIAARTDYIVNGKNDCLLFLTAAKTDREEGRVLCACTTDGGKTCPICFLDRTRAHGFFDHAFHRAAGPRRIADRSAASRGAEEMDRPVPFAR